ncbi:MAG: DUF4344 domain-containing metallopeptidase [Bacteroidia bacterium]|nr:DUF4344 domain-containing metallopeptidase [Bacteroidia bacterium]
MYRLDLIDPGSWLARQMSGAAAEPAQAAADGGRFQVLYALNRSNGHLYTSRAGQIIMQYGLTKAVTDELNASLALPKDLIITFKPCGTSNAWYAAEPGREGITFCDEFFYEFERALAPYYQDQQAYEQAVLGATTFFLLHEVGHALIHQLDLPNLGREEDAADRLAVWLLMQMQRPDLVLGAVNYFSHEANHTLPGGHFPYWDSHGLNEQRYYNLCCWLFGGNPEAFGWLVTQGILPEARAAECIADDPKYNRDIAKLLAPWLRAG